MNTSLLSIMAKWDRSVCPRKLLIGWASLQMVADKSKEHAPSFQVSGNGVYRDF
jgi:hypothetical protein